MLETKMIFNNRCYGWSTDREYNLKFVRHVENMANDALMRNGWVCLNDIYCWLGLPKIIEAQAFGWQHSAGTDWQLTCVKFDVHDGNGPDIKFDLRNMIRLI